MIKKFLRRTSSLLLAAVMTVTLMPAQKVSATGTDSAAGSAILPQQEAGTVVSGQELEPIIVIKGNTPIFPKAVGETEIQWPEWDTSLAVGAHKVTGTADGAQVTVTVTVLPCDEEVPDVVATGASGDSAAEKLAAIHPLNGYKGVFVAEYDIVPDSAKSTHDRAVIYLPEAKSDGTAWDAESCWDTGARLQFKYSYEYSNNDTKTYFQTQIGDGEVAGNAVYYPTNAELDEALEKGDTSKALEFDEKSVYRVRVVMDTATDTEKGNYKIYITDPNGIVHEVTQPGGNGFRIYPTNGIVKNFAAVRGSYQVKNHKISWLSGYANKKVEIYLKGQNAADYVKEKDDIVTKELPGTITENPDTEFLNYNQTYKLNTEKSGWYNGEDKVTSVTAQEGETVTYRAYYDYAAAVDKTELNNKIQEAESLIEEDYTSTSWKKFAEALTDADQVNTDPTVSQATVDNALQALNTAEGNLISVRDLREAINRLKEELEEKEEQKDDYINWDEVSNVLAEAEKVLDRTNATETQIKNAIETLNIKLITRAETETAEAKDEMEASVLAAEQKIAEINEADYTPMSLQTLKDALEACRNLDPETAVKADYDAKKDALERAMEGLTKRADKTALNQAITAANAKDEANYEAAGYKEMQDKLAVANAVAANLNAVQSEVDAARTALLNALNNLVEKSTETVQPNVVKVKSVKRAATTYKIAAGKKLNLKTVFTVSPANADNKKLTYSIDKKYSRYASIKSGVVTVKKAGAGQTIAVKATAADGSGKTATIKIKIMKNAVTKITVKKKSLSVKAGQKVTIKPTVATNGKSANKTLAYTSSNEKLATVKNGVVTTKKGKTGKVTITIASTDGTGKSVKVKITIKK